MAPLALRLPSTNRRCRIRLQHLEEAVTTSRRTDLATRPRIRLLRARDMGRLHRHPLRSLVVHHPSLAQLPPHLSLVVTLELHRSLEDLPLLLVSQVDLLASLARLEGTTLGMVQVRHPTSRALHRLSLEALLVSLARSPMGDMGTTDNTVMDMDSGADID